jgi:hypothetical protein
MVFLTACITDGPGFTGPLRRSLFSVAYSLELIRVVATRKADVL